MPVVGVPTGSALFEADLRPPVDWTATFFNRVCSASTAPAATSPPRRSPKVIVKDIRDTFRPLRKAVSGNVGRKSFRSHSHSRGPVAASRLWRRVRSRVP